MIRHNQELVPLPWNLVINGETIRLSDEDFFTRIRDLACQDLDNNRLDRLSEFFTSLEMLKEHNNRFYRRNSQEIDFLKLRIGSFIGLGLNEPLATIRHSSAYAKNLGRLSHFGKKNDQSHVFCFYKKN